MPSPFLRVALAQTSAHARDLEANLTATARLVADATNRGARVLVLPELSLTGYDLDFLAATPGTWLVADDARLGGLRAACQAHGVTLVVGAAVAGGAGGRPLLAAVVVEPDGRVRVSPKQHLHGREKDVFAPGVPAAPFEVDGWRLAIAVCFDAARPEHAAAAAAAGADVYVVSAIYVAGQEHRLHLHLGARAMDHGMFSVLANVAGRSADFVSCGGSGAWRPDGKVVAQAADATETLLVVDLDRKLLSRPVPGEGARHE